VVLSPICRVFVYSVVSLEAGYLLAVGCASADLDRTILGPYACFVAIGTAMAPFSYALWLVELASNLRAFLQQSVLLLIG
jgi:hypothetical protein